MLIVWISLDFKETGVISTAFSNVYIHWPLLTPGEINRRRNNHFAGFEKRRACLRCLELSKNSWKGLNFPSAQQHFGFLSSSQPQVQLLLPSLTTLRRVIRLASPKEDPWQGAMGGRTRQRKEPPLDTKAARTSAVIDSISPVTTVYGIHHGLCSSHNWSLISIKMIDRTIKIRGTHCLIQYCGS